MTIYRVKYPLFTYEMIDPWGSAHGIYASQLIEWAVVEPEWGVFSTYDNGYTIDKVQMFVERKDGLAVRRFRVEPPFDYCGHSYYRENLGAKWAQDPWIVPNKHAKYVDAAGNPLIFT